GPNEIESPLGAHQCTVPSGCQVGSRVTLAIRPEHLTLLPNANRRPDSIEGTVMGKTYLGDAALLEVRVSGLTLLIKLPGDMDFALGQKTTVVFPSHRWRVFA
ncbi:MAG TPA: TOBE domain-containing protein, partial [Terriglobales bacterium]|nr:TOBE domain-containing protein [Terriglobales bacterium]